MTVCRTAERGPHRSAKEQFTPRRSSVTNFFVPITARVGRTSSTQFLASFIKDNISSIRWQLFPWHGVRTDFQRPYEDRPDGPQKWIRTGRRIHTSFLTFFAHEKLSTLFRSRSPKVGSNPTFAAHCNTKHFCVGYKKRETPCTHTQDR